MRRNATKVAAVVMSLAVTMTSVNLPTTAAAATKKVQLKVGKKTLTVGQTTTLKVTKGGKAVKATFKSNKPKIAKVVKKSGKSTKIKALKKGTAKITATYAKKKYTCKITVKAKKVVKPTTAPTVAPTVEPTVAPTVEPTVTPATAGAITATLKNNLTGYDRVILAGSAADIQVKVTGTDGKPMANKSVTATITDTDATSAVYKMNGFATTTTVTTNAEGVADIVLAPGDAIDNTDSKYTGNYVLTITSDSFKAEKFNFGVATLEYSNLTETTASEKKKRGTNADAAGVKREVTTNRTYDKYKEKNYTTDYVTTQQVSADGKDHSVTFSEKVYVNLPGDINKKATDKVQPVDIKSGSYSTYLKGIASNTKPEATVNKGDFIKFDLDNKDDVKYATLLFNKLSVSKYTKITVYAATIKDDKITKGATIGTSYDMGLVVDDNGHYVTKNQALQIPASIINNYDGVYVEIESAGQVNTEYNEGYDISNITYVYNSKKSGNKEELKGVKINWSPVTDVTYTTNRSLTNSDTIYLDEVQKLENGTGEATYTMPVFPYTGNAIITVYDKSNKAVKYYAVATENEKVIGSASDKTETDDKGKKVYKNENKIIKDAIPYQISKEEAERTVNGTVGKIVESTDTTVTVDSKESGTTFIKGTLESDTIELDAANKYVYTSVMWNPIPKAQTPEAENIFYAVEGQTVKVTAQLKDGNKNIASVAKKKIDFKTKDNTAGLKVGDTIGVSVKDQASAKATVIDITNDGYTDENGKVVLTLKAADAATVYDLVADYKGNDYDVTLVFGNDKQKDKATLKWLGLGLSYTNSTVSDIETVQTTNDNDGRAKSTKISDYRAGEKWEVATEIYAYESAPNGGSIRKVNDIDSYPIRKYSCTDVKVSTKQDTGSVGSIADADNAKVILSSNKDGKGKIKFILKNALGDNAKFKIGDNYETSIGTGVACVDEELTVEYNYGATATNIAFINDMGTKAVSGAAVEAYVKVTDKLGNALANREVAVKVNKGNINASKVWTNSDGIAKVIISQENDEQKYITLTASYKEGSDTITDSNTYEFVQPTAFGIDKAYNANGVQTDYDDVTYNVSTTGGYDTITMRFTDDILATSAKVKNIYKVKVDGKEYGITNIDVSGDKVTLTLNVNLQTLPEDTTISVEIDEAVLSDIGYKFMSVSGVQFKGTISFKKSNLK